MKLETMLLNKGSFVFGAGSRLPQKEEDANHHKFGKSMQCPFCKYKDSQVVDSRGCEDGTVIRRRRKCPNCGARFTTYEKVALTMPLVIKRTTGRRVPYSQEKLAKSLAIALRKRPVPAEAVELAIERIEQKIRSQGEKEIESKLIGEFVLEELEQLDKIAYMRFASVYFNYESAEDFAEALQKLGIVMPSKKRE